MHFLPKIVVAVFWGIIKTTTNSHLANSGCVCDITLIQLNEVFGISEKYEKSKRQSNSLT
jgi:hypothetical protein